ncbi:hypothetical protein Vi05172_g7717 [Venturia inaequalis]|nr:hypothetical protein Vi05172_g7717 [Venturia inaequalis]
MKFTAVLAFSAFISTTLALPAKVGGHPLTPCPWGCSQEGVRRCIPC